MDVNHPHFYRPQDEKKKKKTLLFPIHIKTSSRDFLKEEESV